MQKATRTKIWKKTDQNTGKNSPNFIAEALLPHCPRIFFGDGLTYPSDDMKGGIDTGVLNDNAELLTDLAHLDPKGGFLWEH